MIRIIMVGCNGKMGQNISQIVAEDAAAEIVAGVDFYAVEKNGYPVFDTITACNIEADVMIDFLSTKTGRTIRLCDRKTTSHCFMYNRTFRKTDCTGGGCF